MIKFIFSLFTGTDNTPAYVSDRRWAMATETRETRNERNQWVAFSDRT